MFSTNTYNINNLKNTSFKENTKEQWFDVQDVNDNSQLSNLYNKVCLEHKDQNKWILMINPEDETLEQLCLNKDIDPSKILRVNTRNATINLNSINKALAKGNCSAVILSDPSLKQGELSQLTRSAEQGKTQCILLKSGLTLH